MSAGTPMISVTVEGLPELLARIPDAAKRKAISRHTLLQLALLVEGEAKRRAPARTGNLRRSITHVVDPSGTFAKVTAQARYGPFVEGGTGLYGPKGQLIHPTQARAMRWAGSPTRLSGAPASGSSNYIFARSIKGMHPHPFMRPGFESAMLHVPEVLAEAGKLLTSKGAVA